jgi:uncharacterized protein YndB with AHSA1/START domain
LPDNQRVATDGERGTDTRTVVLEQSIESVWALLVDPQAGMWLTPKAAYTVAPPEPVAGAGELRCCWVNQWKKGIRQQTVWELQRVEPGHHVTFVSRTGPVQVSAEFRLVAEGTGTRLELTFAKQTPLRERLLRHHLLEAGAEHVLTHLLATLRGEPVAPIAAQVMTWAPGNSAKEQVNQITIAAQPKHIWAIADDKDGTCLPHPLQLVTWRAFDDGVEYRYSVTHLPGSGLHAAMTRVIPGGPYRSTTVNDAGVEVVHELLPHDEACLLRTTTSWTALIKTQAIRTTTRAWLEAVKERAETPAD